MPGATPTYGWPYPIATDPLDDAVSTIPQSLALAMENTLKVWAGVAVGAWTALAPVVGAGAGVPQRPLGYRKVGNEVQLRGRINFSGAVAAGATLFTFPVGFRPTGDILLIAAAGYPSPATARISVTSAGVMATQDAFSAGQFLSLDSLRFTVD